MVWDKETMFSQLKSGHVQWPLCMITTEEQISQLSILLTLLPWAYIYGSHSNLTILKRNSECMVKFASLK